MKSFQKETNVLLSLLLRVLDTALVAIVAVAAYFCLLPEKYMPEHYRLAVVLGSTLLFLVFHLLGMYRAWRGSSKVKEFANVFSAVFLTFIMLAFFSVLTKTSASFSRLWFGWWFISSVVAIGGYRFNLRVLLSILRSRGFNQKRIALVGDSNSVTKVVKVLVGSPWLGLNPMFYFLTDDKVMEKASLPLPLVSKFSISEILLSITENRADEIWLALPITEAKKLKMMLNELAVSPCAVRYVPDFFGFDLINHSVTSIGRLPVVNLSVSPLGGWGGLLKWLEDKVLSALILLLVSPILVVLAIGVKLTSSGPVFYKQERVSWNGQRFKMFKFRSMPVDAEKGGVKWGGATSKINTRFGAFIRKTSLDELPQFLNVLRGEMSIVGPRPERTEFVDQFKGEIPRYMQKHMVKGGITGWAQINGWRGDTDLKSRIDADLYYIEKWSIWFDIKIVFLTFFKVFNNASEKS